MEFPDKESFDITKEDIIKILQIEKRLKKTTIFYKSKNDSMPEICVPFYNKDGDETKAMENGRIKNFVICKFKDCDAILTNPGGSIKIHYESHKSRKRPHDSAETPSIATYFADAQQQKMTMDERKEITTILAEYCIESGTSFRGAVSNEMKNLFIKAANFGARRGKIIGENFKLPDRKTVSTKAYSLADEIIDDKKEELLYGIKNIGGIALDYGFRKSDFLSAKIFWINEKWCYKNTILSMMGGIVGKTAAETCAHLLESVSELEVNENMIKEQYFVSDEGQNILNLFTQNGIQSVKCICHVLNTVTKRCFTPYKIGKQLLRETDLTEDEKKHISDATELINSVKIVGNFVRNHGWLRKEVDSIPEDEIATRWLSKLRMIKSVLKIVKRLNELKNAPIGTKMTADFIMNLKNVTKNMEELQNIVKILTIFDENVRFFQNEKIPTIHLVWPKIHEIKKALNSLLKEQTFIDCQLSISIVRSAQKCLQRKLDDGFLNELHKAATFLNPKIRLLNGVSEYEKNNIYEFVRKELRKRKRNPSVDVDETNSFSLDNEDLLNDVDDEAFLSENPAREQRRSAPSEIEQYISNIYDNDAKECATPLEFWKKNATSLPLLSQVAKSLLSLPASSSGVERCFSRLKYVMDDQRFSLCESNTSKLLMADSLKKI